MSSFLIVTLENLEDIKGRLACKEGRILIVEPGHQSYGDDTVDAQLNLYARPLIEGDWLCTERKIRKIHNEIRQTNWQHDRYYLLRKTQASNDPMVNFCRSLFDHLAVGPYEFSIGFQSVAGRALFSQKSMVLFVPKRKKIEFAFRYGLAFILNEIKKEDGFSSGEPEIEKIVTYIMDDLRTKKSFRKNVAAGLEADKIMGMA